MRIPHWLIILYRRRRDERILHPRERDPIRRYHDVNRPWGCAARLAGAVERLVVSPRKPGPIPPPKAVLLANLGHLGDVVMSTAALGVVRRAFPQARVGFLVNAASRVVLENHPHVRRLHILDHWRLERTGEPLAVRIPRYVHAARRVAEEIRREGYDVAVDLRAWWPNAAWVLALAGVPARAGYPCWGIQSLLTHPVRFRFARKHESAIQCDALRALPIDPALFENPPFDMPPPSVDGAAEAARVLGVGNLREARYVVVHAGASTPVRNWSTARWRELADRWLATGRTLVFTGHGPRDQSLIADIIESRPRCINACNALNWAGLVELIRAAELTVSVETVAGHVAVALGTPCVGVYGGMSDPLHWAPRPGATSRFVVRELPCAPCFHYNGCTARPCLAELAVDAVVEASDQALKPRGL